MVRTVATALELRSRLAETLTRMPTTRSSSSSAPSLIDVALEGPIARWARC